MKLVQQTHAVLAAVRPAAPAGVSQTLRDVFPRLLLLSAAGLVMQIGWLIVWMLSYRLTHGNQFTFTYLSTYGPVWERLYDLLVLGNTMLPGLEPPQTLDVLVNSLVVGFGATAVGYLAALLLLDRGLAHARGSLAVVLGFAALFQVTLFTLPGVYTTDIFSYLMYGEIAAAYDLNPYVHPPAAFPSNPLLAWIHPIWHNARSVYGPLWTNISWLVANLVVPFRLDLMHQVLVYKLLMGGLHLANLGLVWHLLGRLRPQGGSPRARLVAFTLFAWNPLVLFEVVGNAHNDALMVTLLLLSVVPLARSAARDPRAGGRDASPLAWLAAAVSVALSALVKYTTGLVGLFYVVAWMRRLPTWRRRVAWTGAAGVVVLALIVALFWPWLRLPESLQPILDAAGGKYYTNSLPDLAALTLADQVIDPHGLRRFEVQEEVRGWMKLATRSLFGLYLLGEIWWLWRVAGRGMRAALDAALAASVRAFLALLLLVLMWVLTWYFLWPLALATLLGWRRMLTKVTVGFTLTALPVFYIHHYWSDHMPGTLLFAYVLPPLLVPAAEWALRRWRQRIPARTTLSADHGDGYACDGAPPEQPPGPHVSAELVGGHRESRHLRILPSTPDGDPSGHAASS